MYQGECTGLPTSALMPVSAELEQMQKGCNEIMCIVYTLKNKLGLSDPTANDNSKQDQPADIPSMVRKLNRDMEFVWSELGRINEVL